MSKRRAHIFVRGRVQGVSFRYYTLQQSKRRGLEGWVRNLPDGRVEAVFEGEAEAVEAMVAWCGSGPPSAVVESVDVNWEEPTGTLGGFRIGGY